MEKFITANGIREVHTRGELAMPVVLHASIITPKARGMVNPLDLIITECGELIPVMASVPTSASAGKTGSQRIREITIIRLPESQLTESLIARLMERVAKEKQSLEQGVL